MSEQVAALDATVAPNCVGKTYEGLVSGKKFRHRIKTAIWDIETDGLLPTLTRVHCLVIRDYERQITHRFRRNATEDTIDEGIDLLEDAELTVGHNSIQFDLPALEKVYEGINFRGKQLDTLVMSRVLCANQKDKDFRLFEQKKLPGNLIGAHGLEAWGWRKKLHKGDYAKEMEAKGLDPWAEWNIEQEDYCENDVDITTILYRDFIKKFGAPEWRRYDKTLEHQIHDLMGQQERNGIHFNVPDAQLLAREFDTEATRLSNVAVEHYGMWWVPAKKRIVAPLWTDPEGKNEEKVYELPREEFGEDYSRKIWADVTVPKKNMSFTDVMRGDRRIDAPYCAVKLQEFNPNSRPQIIDRFQTVYRWNPVDFTETGRPEVSDDVLRKLIGHIPMAVELAEVFYFKKRLGQLATGPQAWLKKVVDGKIHGYCNVGGTISGRASHVSPNLAQVPKVKHKKGVGILKGRAGDHGWESRNLFYVPDGWTLIGTDLSGIELRCLGEKMRKYGEDKGAYLELILNGDIHTHNMNAAGLSSRDQAKTFIYALVYGAGDVKLGSIVEPLASEDEQRDIGRRLRARFMDGLPAFKKLMRWVSSKAAGGELPGLDGRVLYVRSPHSALNTLLQSDAALIAKKWVCITEELLEEEGLNHGWDEDFVQLLWIHDEEQIGARDEYAQFVSASSRKAAAMAGTYFGYECPIAAESKMGKTWAETH